MPKPPRKTPAAGYPIMSDEDRALAELQRRRERAASKSEALPEFVESAPSERVERDDEITSPIDLIDISRYQEDPEYRKDWDQVVNQFNDNAAYRILWNRFGRSRRDSGQAAQSSANSALSATDAANKVSDVHQKLASIEGELRDVTTVLRITKWILGFVIAATLSSIVVVVTKVFNWGVDSGQIQLRIETLEREVHHLDRGAQP